LAKVLPFLLPFLLYLVRWTLVERLRPAGLARDEGLVLVSSTAALVMLPLITLVLLHRMRQQMVREHRLALRIVLSSVLVAVVLYLLLGRLPDMLGAGAVLDLSLQPAAMLVPLVGIVIAVLRYRLYEMDLMVRRSLLLVVTGGLAGMFLALAGLLAPRLDGGVGAVLLGAALALGLLPQGSSCFVGSAGWCSVHATTHTRWCPSYAGSGRA